MSEFPNVEADFTFQGDDAVIRFAGDIVEWVEIIPPQEGGDVRVRWKYKAQNFAIRNAKIWGPDAGSSDD